MTAIRVIRVVRVIRAIRVIRVIRLDLGVVLESRLLAARSVSLFLVH